MRDGHAGVAIGSEISGDCRNVFVENCEMSSPELGLYAAAEIERDAGWCGGKYFHAELQRGGREGFGAAD